MNFYLAQALGILNPDAILAFKDAIESVLGFCVLLSRTAPVMARSTPAQAAPSLARFGENDNNTKKSNTH